jgi:hypothetical protein
MNLSAEMFDEIVRCLRSDGSTSEHEQRKSPRVGLRAQADVLLKPGTRTPPVRMRVRDLSVGGIGLLHTRAVPPGTEFVVLLPTARRSNGYDCDAVVHLSCIAAHCREIAPDTYTVGGRIIRVLSDEEAALLAAERG